jgi:hypothetical protein
LDTGTTEREQSFVATLKTIALRPSKAIKWLMPFADAYCQEIFTNSSQINYRWQFGSTLSEWKSVGVVRSTPIGNTS